jgi:hypothetical protein
MGIDRTIGRRLGAEMDQQAGQHRMLDDVGKISSVKGMPVVHRAIPESIYLNFDGNG